MMAAFLTLFLCLPGGVDCQKEFKQIDGGMAACTIEAQRLAADISTKRYLARWTCSPGNKPKETEL